MNLILSALKEASIRKKINIYVTGQYIVDKILGNNITSIDVILENETKDIIDMIVDKIQSPSLKIERKDMSLKVKDTKNRLAVNIMSMKETVIEEELRLRAFKVDSMAIRITDLNSMLKKHIIDPYGGLEDLDRGIITHNHSSIFINNPINVLKAIRLMSHFNFNLDQQTEKLLINSKESMEVFCADIIREELFEILKHPNTSKYFRYMDEELNILELIFPEVNPMRDIGKCKYHVVNVLEHSLYTLEILEDIIYSDNYFENHIKEVYVNHSQKEVADGHNRLEFMKLGAFFHDVGKPCAMKVDETGRTRFKGHEITGAEIIESIGERLKLTVKERKLLYRIVEKHMIPLVLYKKNDVGGKALYKMFKELKDDTLDLLLIALADIIATRKLLDPSEEMGKFKVHVEYMANNYLTRFKEIEDLSHVITKKDIIKNFTLDTDITVDDIMEEVRKAIYLGKISKSKKSALKHIEGILEE